TVAHDSPYGSFSTYAQKNPYDTFLDEDVTYLKTLKSWFGHSAINGNPLYDATLKSYNRTRQNEFVNNLNLRWTILQNLRLDSRFALSKLVGQSQNFRDPAASMFENSDFTKKGSKSILDDQFESWDFNALLLYGLA